MEQQNATAQIPRLSPDRLAVHERNGDMPHRCIGLGAMPVSLSRLDMHDITHIDLALLMLRGHHSRARSYDQQLIAAVRVPTCRAALAEIHHTAVVIRGIPGFDDGLA